MEIILDCIEGKYQEIVEKGDKYWLSILVPAYEHPTGVCRILDSLIRESISGIQCIISDDSISNHVENIVKSHEAYRSEKVIYIKNEPTLGAVKNWNKLIHLSEGTYVILMHHDESPKTLNFYSILMSTLKSDTSIDAIIMDCYLPVIGFRRVRRHMPIGIKKFIFNNSLCYLLRHNIVGPTSTCIIRREKILTFDENLKWSVDVDWMVRCFVQPDFKVKFSKELAMISIPHPNSITDSIRNDISILRIKEAKIIREKTRENYWVFSIMLPNTIYFYVISITEKIGWMLFRITYRLFCIVNSQKMPRFI